MKGVKGRTNCRLPKSHSRHAEKEEQKQANNTKRRNIMQARLLVAITRRKNGKLGKWRGESHWRTSAELGD